MGMVLQGGAGQIPSRPGSAQSWAPLGRDVGNVEQSVRLRVESVTLAEQIIRSGDTDVIVAGGMESMSQAPYICPQPRSGHRIGTLRRET